MRLTDYLDKGASLGPEAPCLTTAGHTLSYGEVQQLAGQIAAALGRSGVAPGDKVAILSANDPVAFSCASPGPGRSGARSTRATRRPRTATCSTSSTAGA